VSLGLLIGPRSLVRGETHLVGLFRMVEGDGRVARVKVVVEEREERTKINRDGVDGGFKTPLAPQDSVRYRRM